MTAERQERWTTVRVRPSGDAAPVIEQLFAVGAEGVQELDAQVVTHIRDLDVARARAAIHSADAGAEVQFEPLGIQDWSAAWRARVGAHRVGALVVTPPWLAGDFAPDERIVIDPAMAFGTGEHETTRGVLRLMPRVVRDGDFVADLGAGSAVLSIAAARLGAARVVAIEIDPDAIGNAEANVAANDVSGAVSVMVGDATTLLPLLAPVRVVLANIIVPVLEQLLPIVAESLAPDGAAILSGILVEERDAFERTLRASGWEIGASDAEGLWWSVVVRRPR